MNKILKALTTLCVGSIPLSTLVVTSCSKEEDIPTGPQIEEVAKSQTFVDRKVKYDFIWLGWRPKDNKFDNVSITMSGQATELQLKVTDASTIAPNKSFSIEVSITNATLPLFSDIAWFNLEFDCTIQSKKQHFVTQDLIGQYLPDKLIVEPDKKQYDMFDLNDSESYTVTDKFILTDKNIKPSDLDISVTQLTGIAFTDIFVDTHATGQWFYLQISVDAFNPYATDYKLKIDMSYNGQVIYTSSDFSITYKPVMIEKEKKSMRCFPTNEEANEWVTTEDFYFLHAPFNEDDNKYKIDFSGVPTWEITNSQFHQTGIQTTDYSLSVKFKTREPVKQYTNWDVGITLEYNNDPVRYSILDDSKYSFYTAPAIDTHEMHVEADNLVDADEVQYTKIEAQNLIWLDKFDSSFDILDNPIIISKSGAWPDDVVEPIVSFITPSETGDNKFTTTFNVYRSSGEPLPYGWYTFVVKFQVKDQQSNLTYTDEIECNLNYTELA